MDAETGELLISHDRMMNEEDAKTLENRHWIQLNPNAGDVCSYDPKAVDEDGNPVGRPTVMIRTVLTCRAKSGVCARCYGMNLATQQPVGPGEAVGIIAAQSIGEPGTQLTMRTFHTGGLAGGDITQGLPRVEELFEARKPKRMATLSEIAGTIRFEEATRGSLLNIIVTNEEEGEPHTGLLVRDGDHIEKGTQLTYGALNPHDVLRIRGADAVYNYLIQEVLRVYRQQGVDINDKHIEVIVRQMMRKIRLEDAGDTDLLDGSMVDVLELDAANEEIDRRTAAGERNEDGEPLRKASGTQLLMGITKASLATDSFLSAASFQETTKVLTEAAIKGKSDHLTGLKENVIIGKLIPAGTGLQIYQKLARELFPEETEDVEPDVPMPESTPESAEDVPVPEGAETAEVSELPETVTEDDTLPEDVATEDEPDSVVNEPETVTADDEPETVVTEELPEDIAEETALPEDVAEEDTLPEDEPEPVAEEDTLPEDVAEEDTLPEDEPEPVAEDEPEDADVAEEDEPDSDGSSES